MSERLPPFSLEAERCVLGSMIRDNTVIDDVALILPSAEAFHTDAHQKIYRAITAMHKDRSPIDLPLLGARLNSAGQFEDIGRGPYLFDVYDAAPTAANATYYAKIVREKWIFRKTIHVCNEILCDAYDPVNSADDFLAGAERSILEIAEQEVTSDVAPLQAFLQKAAQRYDRRYRNEEPPGLLTGYSDFDNITTGFKPAESIILAARPSVGKTAFGLNILRTSIFGGTPAFFASLEMPGIDIADRLACSVSRIDGRLVRAGRIDPGDMAAFQDAHHRLSAAKLFVDDRSEQTMGRIAANARRLKRRENIGLIVIDYLQIVKTTNKRIPRREQVDEIARDMRSLARELNIPVIMLAQINRESEERTSRKPMLHDLKESGAIEENADIVALLSNPVENGIVNNNVIEVDIAKNRNGPKKTFRLTFLRDCQRIENHAIADD